MADTKKNDKPAEETAENNEKTKKNEPATLDAGEAVDPFERLTKKRVAVPKSLNAAESTEQVTSVIKKGSKISPKIFLIGCGGFFILFLVMAYAGLYYAVQSSEFLQSVGLEIEDVKAILIIFAVLFFGIVFFAGFYMLVLNIYRLVTVKGKKAKFIFGLVWGLLIIITTIIFGTLSITKIRALGGRSTVITNMLVLPYVVTKDGTVWVNEGIPVIAPLKMRFQLNKQQVDRNIIPILWANSQITSFEVDCGNQQKLSATQQIYLGQTNNFFPDYCLYLAKGTYPITMTVNYLNTSNGEVLAKTFPVGNFNIGAEVKLEPVEDTARLNDKLNEYIIGTAPVTVKFRAQLLFSDLGLKDDRIIRDLNGDGQKDLENNSAFEFPFGRSQLFPIYYKLPGLGGKYGETRFSFDLRVLESELAQCQLQLEPLDNDKRYRRTPKFDELINVASYQYTIVDLNQDTIIDKFKDSKQVFSYAFKQGGRYEIQTSYFTPEGQKGSCEPKEIEVGFNGNQVSFDLRRSQDESTPFVKIGTGTPVSFDVVEGRFDVRVLPAILEFTVTGVQPDPTAKVELRYDGKQIFEDHEKVFEVPISTIGTKELKFVIVTAQGNTSEQPYDVVISRVPVKAMIEASPLVGEDPLEVTLDASISPLYDETDEIVYFTWDFGDGQSKSNISQGKVVHTYTFDPTKDDGQYYPSVTVKTRLGYTDTYRMTTPIVIKKQQKSATIQVESHPTQQVRVGETVSFRVATDGQVEHIDRNFWNEQVLGCDDRSCATAPAVYTAPGEYTIVAEIQYANDVPVTARVRIKVY